MVMITVRLERSEKHPVKVKKNKAEMKKEMKGRTENKGNTIEQSDSVRTCYGEQSGSVRTCTENVHG